MANPEHVKMLDDGVHAWNRWRKLNPNVRPWLANADLSGMDLSRVNLSWVSLRECKLRRSVLDHADFRGADLEGADATECKAPMADFSRSQLRQVKFGNSDLRGAVFTSALLRKARLAGANLERAVLSGTRISRCSVNQTDFSRALLYETSFIDLDLSESRGLEKCQHHGPSVIDRRTLMRSSSLPKGFLRGCGLNDWEIAAADLFQKLSAKEVIDIGYRLLELRNVEPIQYFSCFISYSHGDRTFAHKLHDYLQEEGIRCWLDEKKICPGDDIFDAIDEGLRLWDKVLLCCSEHSLNSWWCDKEIGIALEKEQELTNSRERTVRTIIPLNLDGYLFDKAWKSGYRAEIRRRLAADFMGWDERNFPFGSRVKDLVNALRVEKLELPPISKL